MKRVPLTNSEKFALVDESDWELVSQYKWHIDGSGYASHHAYYGGGRKSPRRKRFLMHRLVMDAPVGTMLDHKNRDRLDNRRSNLRFCEYGQNRVNSRINSNNTSGYKGVARQKNVWIAYAQQCGKRVHLGRFSSPVDAARARDAFVKKVYGGWATLNEISGA